MAPSHSSYISWQRDNAMKDPEQNACEISNFEQSLRPLAYLDPIHMRVAFSSTQGENVPSFLHFQCHMCSRPWSDVVCTLLGILHSIVPLP